MDSFNVVRNDFFDQYLAWGRDLLSDALAWGLNLIGRPEGVSWDVASKFVSDYVLLPLVVLLVLLIVVKQALSD
jgi:hypothetical protein